jgi:hypothetical protein
MSGQFKWVIVLPNIDLAELVRWGSQGGARLGPNPSFCGTTKVGLKLC